MEPSVLKALLRFLHPCLWAAPAMVVLGIMAFFAESFSIGLLIPFLDILMRGEVADTRAGGLVETIRSYATLIAPENQQILLGASIFGLIAIKSGLLFLSGFLSALIYGRVSHTLRVDLFRKITGDSYAAFAGTAPGRLFNMLTLQIWKSTDAVIHLLTLFIAGGTIAAFGTFLMLMSWQLTLGVAAGLALIQLVVTMLSRRAERLGCEAVTAEHILADRLGEVLNSIRIVHAFGQEANEQKRFMSNSDQVRQNYLRSDVFSAAVHPLLELLYVPLFLVVLFVAWQAAVELSTVLAFLLLLYRIQPHLKLLDSSRIELNNHAGIILSVVNRLNQSEGATCTLDGTLPFDGLCHSIAFRRVRFRYHQGEALNTILSDVSFEICARKVTAIVGRSGAGKSTLINLLYRFYDVDHGEILVDGRPLKALDRSAWRSRLAIAGQDADLLGRTVGEVIAFGCPGASQAEIVAAARLADAQEFIEALPAGYDTLVGSRGLQLSGGQRQRIALARALLRKPDILILDEATNALDYESEIAVQNALLRLAGTLTIIVIAHRMSTIRGADHVVVLDKGRVTEQGPPGELLQIKGHFSRLYYNS